ncbi:MAG: polysaccharide biosynthesis tyrosine autokinase [Erythrobacter sp.]
MRQFAPPPTSPNSGVLEDEAPLFRQYLEIALRRRYVIVIAVAACLALAAALSLLMTPKFTAIATIEISRESGNVTNIQGVEREANIADQEFYQTQYGLLRARTLSERVALELGLPDDPAFFESFGHSSEDAAFDLVEGRYSATGRIERTRVAGEILLDNLEVNPTRLSRLVNINVRAPDPEFAASVANSWATNFIESNLERKIDATSFGRELLEGELAQTKEQLDESQRKLVDYASSQQIITFEGEGTGRSNEGPRSLVSDEMAALNRALAQATSERIEAQARFEQARASGTSTESLGNAALNRLRERRAELNSEYERLLTQFEPGYPRADSLRTQIKELEASIDREEARVSTSLLGDFREAQQRERALTSRVDELKGEFIDLRRRSIQYNIFQTEVDTNRALYDGLLRRYEEIGIAGEVGVNNVAIVDTAVPPEDPSSPNIPLNLALAFVAGLGLGVLGALVFEQMDEAISDIEQLKRISGLPLLGVVPRAENDDPQSSLVDRKSDISEAYFAIQTNLSFSTANGVPNSIAITSTRPDEGKSNTALALATVMARAKRNVVLIDCDMRSPSLHTMCERSVGDGLSTFLSGSDDLEPLLFKSDEYGFMAMTAGPTPPNAAELLTGPRLGILIDRLLDLYDHIILDCPPVLGLADAPLVASQVGGLVYVVEFEKTNSKALITSLERLESANANVLGTVMIKHETKHGKSDYGYSYGYGP